MTLVQYSDSSWNDISKTVSGALRLFDKFLVIWIDKQVYDIPVQSVKRKAEFIEKYAVRTEDGAFQRALLGVYFNYKLQLGSTVNTEEYARLWVKLTEPVAFHTVTVPDESGDFTFTAYFTGVGDELRKQSASKNYWTGLTVDFVAKTPVYEGVSMI